MRIFYAVLDMGLGHATRSLPVIRTLQARGAEVSVGSSGGALELLRRECPDLSCFELPAYGIRYGRKGASLPGLLFQAPGMLRTIRAEHQRLQELAAQQGTDRVVSDHRYGCWHPDLPSFFITHQIRFAAPVWLRPFEGLGTLFNRRYHRRYDRILIPDEEAEGGREGVLSGRLSRLPGRADASRYVFAGPLSSLEPDPGDGGEPLDVFVSVSGPEPQRTVFEHLVLRQIRRLEGRREVALGLPGSSAVQEPEPGLVVHEYLDREGMADRMRRAGVVVCRSGYSTLMELSCLGGRALLVPTPGQTEQLHLARRMAERGWARGVSQQRLDLPDDLARARELDGFPRHPEPADPAERFADIILETP